MERNNEAFIYLVLFLADAAGRLVHSSTNTRLTKEERVKNYQSWCDDRLQNESNTKTLFLRLFILKNFTLKVGALSWHSLTFKQP